MIDEISQNGSGMFLIVTHLGTAVGVRKRCYILNRSADQALSLALDGLSHIIDTAYGWNDPDLVADTDFSVRPAVTLKEPFLCRSDGRILFLVGVGEQIAQSGL